jgi:hypothetical protein
VPSGILSAGCRQHLDLRSNTALVIHDFQGVGAKHRGDLLRSGRTQLSQTKRQNYEIDQRKSDRQSLKCRHVNASLSEDVRVGQPLTVTRSTVRSFGTFQPQWPRITENISASCINRSEEADHGIAATLTVFGARLRAREARDDIP